MDRQKVAVDASKDANARRTVWTSRRTDKRDTRKWGREKWGGKGKGERARERARVKERSGALA